jgi:hypothetical protein
LCTALIRASPHPSQNLIAIYNLEETTTSVRRVDPATGEKINKLRKSYEGKIKELRIAGRNKAIQTPGEFSYMLGVPEEDWHNTQVHGKEIPERIPNLDRLRKACQIVQGPLPAREAEKWKALLATDDPVVPPKLAAATAKGPLASQRPSNASTPLQGVGAAQQGLNVPPQRPARSTAKRSYQDASFAGYGEGFVDDEDASDDDGRSNSGARKRRKKESEFSVSPLPQQQQYGVGVLAGGPRH